MEKSKLLVDAGLGFYTQYVDATKNSRKLSWVDLFRFGPAMLILATALSGFSEAVKEWENANDEDRAELNTYVKDAFKIEDQNLEDKIEAGISIGVKLGSMIEDVKTLFQKSGAPELTGQTV